MNGAADSNSGAPPAVPREQVSTPAPATPSPAPQVPKPQPSGCWRVFKRIVAAIYLAGATAISLFFVSFTSEGGDPVSAYLPADHAILIHIKSGDAIWRGLETDPRVLALANDPDVIKETGWEKKWKEMQAGWEKLPEFLRNEFPFNRAGLSCVVGGEAAFAMQLPGPRQKPPILIFARLNGGGGAVLRFMRWLASILNRNVMRDVHDLGGGLIAIAKNGAELEGNPAPADPMPFPKDALAEVVLRPEAVLKIMPLHIKSMPPPPPVQEIVGVHLPPKDLRLLVRAPGDGSLTLEGAWIGELPPVVEPAPLFDAGQHADRKPVIEAEVPFNMRAAFLNWLDNEMKTSSSGSDKNRRRWENRLLELDKAEVDLNKDLWPAFGQRLKLAVIPPDEENGEKIANILISLPFEATDAARRALGELGRVRWDGLAENREKAEEDWKIYVRRFTQGEAQRFVLVKKTPPIPLWMITGKSFAGIFNAGPLAPMWGAPELALEKPDAANKGSRPIFFLRVDGKRLAPQAAILAQSLMEDERDDDKEGAAKFMEKYPDEQLYIRLTEKLSRFAGDVEFEMRAAEGAEGKSRAIIKGRWQPGIPAEPEGGK